MRWLEGHGGSRHQRKSTATARWSDSVEESMAGEGSIGGGGAENNGKGKWRLCSCTRVRVPYAPSIYMEAA